MSLPSNEDVQRFLTGLGTNERQVAASLEMLGARDNLNMIPSNMPVVRNCAIAMALRIRFPELNDDGNWAVGMFSIRFVGDGPGGLPRLVGLPGPVRHVMDTVDEERTRLALGHDFVPTYPKLMAPKGES